VPARFRIENPALAQQMREIEQWIHRAGGRTWLVGGSVRDLALGRQPRDLDLEISGLPPGQLHALLTECFSVQFVGKAIGLF
jgi:tRNA nucleotidyltransferase (CCA-adding enzyme)